MALKYAFVCVSVLCSVCTALRFLWCQKPCTHTETHTHTHTRTHMRAHSHATEGDLAARMSASLFLRRAVRTAPSFSLNALRRGAAASSSANAVLRVTDAAAEVCRGCVGMCVCLCVCVCAETMQHSVCMCVCARARVWWWYVCACVCELG